MRTGLADCGAARLLLCVCGLNGLLVLMLQTEPLVWGLGASGPTLYFCGYVRRCPTLPQPPGCSTIGAVGLSFRVRDGTGRFPHAITTGNLYPRPMVGETWFPVVYGNNILLPTTLPEPPHRNTPPGPCRPGLSGPGCVSPRGVGVVGGQPHSEREHHT